MNDISIANGSVAAPSDLLLAIALGLLTNRYWWLEEADAREAVIQPDTLDDVWQRMISHLDSNPDDLKPEIHHWPRTNVLQWEPGETAIAANTSLMVRITVEPGNEEGIIAWKVDGGRSEIPSPFMAALLAVLPHPTGHEAMQERFKAAQLSSVWDLRGKQRSLLG